MRDGLKEAINAASQETQMQQRIVDMMRNSATYVPMEDSKAASATLKSIHYFIVT